MERRKIRIEELEQFFNKNNFTEKIVIKNNETVLNPTQTAKSFIRILKANPKNKSFLPYYRNLLAIYSVLCTKYIS